MPQRTFTQGDRDHVSAGLFHRLLNRHRHFSRLAVTEANLAVAVTDDTQRREAEDSTTFDHFGHTIDGYQFFKQAVA